MQNRREYYLTEPLFPLLVRTAIPTMIGMLINMIYNLTDTFFIGMLNDKSMTASIGLVYSVVSLVQALGFWFGYGSGNRMSRALGAKEEGEAKILAIDGVFMALLTGILFSILLIGAKKPLVQFLVGNGSEKLAEYTGEYLQIMALGISCSIVGTTIYNQLRLCGNAKDGMIGMLSGIVINMVLDPILILGLRMKIAGAGYATVAGQIAGCAILWYLSYQHGNIPVQFSFLKWTKKRIYHILAGGAPNFSRQSITSVATFLLNQAAAVYGDETIAGFTIATRITAFGYLIMIGFGQGFQPICGINYGAGQYQRVKQAYRMTVLTGTGFLCTVTILMALFAEKLSAWMILNPAVIQISARIIRFQCISMPFIAFYAVSSMFMQNIGKYGTALLISVLRQGVFFLPVILLFPSILGETGLYLSQPVADMLSVLVTIFIMRKSLHAFPTE